jgi:hypothetical protein
MTRLALKVIIVKYFDCSKICSMSFLKHKNIKARCFAISNETLSFFFGIFWFFGATTIESGDFNWIMYITHNSYWVGDGWIPACPGSDKLSVTIKLFTSTFTSLFVVVNIEELIRDVVEKRWVISYNPGYICFILHHLLQIYILIW